MFQFAVRFATIAIALLLFAASASASSFSRGPAGANAAFLRSPDPNTDFLTGAGVNVGQVEIGRPPKDGLDSPANLNSEVDPVEVYRKNLQLTAPTGANANLADHATWTAMTMVGSLSGAAPEASLYSSAFETTGIDTGNSDALLSIQRIATRPNSAGTRTISNSWGVVGTPNGSSNLTRGIDWLASKHDVLLVFAGNEQFADGPIPDDNFNGITVAASEVKDGIYRKAWGSNIFDQDPDPFVERTFTDLLAPGEDILVTGLGDAPDLQSGTSFAVPHVAGAAALLHQYGDYQVANVGGIHWDFDNAKRHEVMKAVLLNSADKLDGVHGSKRTVESNVEGGNYIWTDTDAFNLASVSLDLQLGAGHLNAKRALTQYSGGEWNAGSTVPAIGWDFHETGGTGTTLRYTLPENLGGYFAITLVWDRQVTKIGGSDNTYDPTNFFTTGFNDLDVYLAPVG